MAIDAVIADVYEVEDGYLLELAPRHQADVPYPSIAGQHKLLIDSPTWKPEPGMYVWGSERVEIVWPDLTESRWYYRPHYRKMYENFNKADASTFDYWLQHGRARGEPKP